VYALRELGTVFGHLALLPFRYTEPENVSLQNRFVNALMVIYCELDEIEVKSRLNAIEARLGRDRNDPERSTKDRTADLDIITYSDVFDVSLFRLAPEGYVAMCLEGQGEQPELESYGLTSPEGASTVYIDALTGDIGVLNDKFHGFVNWVETTFPGQ